MPLIAQGIEKTRNSSRRDHACCQLRRHIGLGKQDSNYLSNFSVPPNIYRYSLKEEYRLPSCPGKTFLIGCRDLWGSNHPPFLLKYQYQISTHHPLAGRAHFHLAQSIKYLEEVVLVETRDPEGFPIDRLHHGKRVSLGDVAPRPLMRDRRETKRLSLQVGGFLLARKRTNSPTCAQTHIKEYENIGLLAGRERKTNVLAKAHE